MLDGVQVGSTADVDADTGVSFTLGSAMILAPGKTDVVEIYGDAKEAGGTNFDNADTVAWPHSLTLFVRMHWGCHQCALSAEQGARADDEMYINHLEGEILREQAGH